MARSIAARTIALVGMRTVVSAGTPTSATGMSSKPLMLTSPGTSQTAALRGVEHAHGDDVGGRYDGGRPVAQVHQLVEGRRATKVVVHGLLAVGVGDGQAVAMHRGYVGVFALGHVAQAPRAREGDALDGRVPRDDRPRPRCRCGCRR